MDLGSFFLGRGDFKTADQILEIVDAYPTAQQHGSPAAEALLIFQTSKQQTWLVASTGFLACVLDDLNKGFTRVQWILPARDLVRNGEVMASISTSDKTERTGRLRINDRGNWLISKRLFTSRTIEATVRDLIARAMIRQQASSGTMPQSQSPG